MGGEMLSLLDELGHGPPAAYIRRCGIKSTRCGRDLTLEIVVEVRHIFSEQFEQPYSLSRETEAVIR
jgi:hypothetical protein